MSNKINGGPAFPHIKKPAAPGIEEVVTDGGMTLRDYFAAKAMQAMISAHEPQGAIPGWAYEMADAMLRAREAS